MKKAVLPLILLIIGLLAGYYYGKSKTSASANAGPFVSANSISRAEAQMLVDTFGVYGLQDANHVPGGKGIKTRAAFIPLTKLDSLCAALNAEKQKDPAVDGIRIYFGRYPKLQPDGKTPYKYAYRNTILLVSTKQATMDAKVAGGRIVFHKDFFGAPNSKKALFMLVLDPDDRVELCPDNCTGAELDSLSSN